MGSCTQCKKKKNTSPPVVPNPSRIHTDPPNHDQSPANLLMLGSKDVIVTENSANIKDYYEIGNRIGKGICVRRLVWRGVQRQAQSTRHRKSSQKNQQGPARSKPWDIRANYERIPLTQAT